MASTPATFPGTRTTEAVGSENANDWTNPTNIGADDGSEAQITAATYDSPDISYRLKAQNFGFDDDIPAGSTIDGILVEIDRRSIVSGSGKDYRVQLLDATGALIGNDKADTVTVWPTTSTVASYGGSTDKWGWTAVGRADVIDVDFGVVLSCQAQIANADIGVDFMRVTVYYSPPAGLSTASAADSDRSIENGYTDVAIVMTEAMQTTAAVGDAVKIEVTDDGGTNWYGTTYRSGSGTANWKVRLARVANNGDTIQVRYRAAATGATVVAVDDQTECYESTITATNNLTKRFAIALKDKTNALIVSSEVGYTFTDVSGSWTATTTSSGGWIDVQYTGSGAVGSSQYVAVRKPNTSPTEAFVWTFTVQ